MEINQIRYFRAVVQYNSFSEAAEHLYITQPALSKSIAKLEQELGAPLFERKGNHITLTPAGKTFLPYCGTILNTVESSVTAFEESIGLKKGSLVIGISSEVFIKHLILHFLTTYPDVSLTCHLMTQDEMTHALEEGKVDFVISDQPIYQTYIEWVPIHYGHLTAVLHYDDKLLERDSIKMSDLKDHRFCFGHLRFNLYSAVFDLCREAGFTPQIRYLGYDPDMAGMLLNIPGSVIVSSDSIDRSIIHSSVNEHDKFHSVPIQNTEGRSVIGIASRKSHYQSEAALAFRKLVTDFFSSL